MKNKVLRNNQDQAETLAELGDRLQQFRHQQGMSLEQVAAKTLIPVRTLTAIEEGKLERLPEPVYIQGFIRRYADAVGINGAEFACAFPTRPISLSTRSPWRLSFRAQLRPLHLYLLYMVLVAGAVSSLSSLLNRSSSPLVGTTQTSTTLAQPLSTKASAPQIGPVPPQQLGPAPQGETGTLMQPGTVPLTLPSDKTSKPPTIAAGKAVRVGLTLTDQSWVRIVADGKTEFEGVLPEGTQRTWVATQAVTVRAGNAGGVLVSLNEGKARPLGEPGSVEEITFGSKTQSATAPQLSPEQTLTASSSGLF